jgi:two-component system LytT family response regulator
MKNTIVHVGSRTHLISSDIVLLVADINYTSLYLSNGEKLLVSYNLGKLQERLSSHKTFIRPNRNTIVNMDYVTDFDLNFIQINQKNVLISRRRKENILSELGKHTDFI